MGWDDDNHRFKHEKDRLYKNYNKAAGKLKKATAQQEDADQNKPTIKSWEYVAELTTKDFDQAKKLMIPFVPRGEWVSDKFCRGGKVTYEGTPQCKWHRLQTKDYKHVVRLIHYKNKMILQKAVLLGAEEEQQQQEEEEEEAAAEEPPVPPPPPPQSSKSKRGKGKKAAEAEAPQDAPKPKRSRK